MLRFAGTTVETFFHSEQLNEKMLWWKFILGDRWFSHFNEDQREIQPQKDHPIIMQKLSVRAGQGHALSPQTPRDAKRLMDGTKPNIYLSVEQAASLTSDVT